MTELVKGYFIEGAGYGGSHGPRAKELSARARAETPEGACPLYGASSTHVSLVYGKPDLSVTPHYSVKPLDAAYELLQYDDPREREHVYVTRHDPKKIVWGEDRNAIEVPLTPALQVVFDERLPEWHRQHKLYLRRLNYAFNRGMDRAGVTPSDKPPYPADGTAEEQKIAREGRRKFERTVIAHMRAPKPLLVPVEGLDELLAEIPITSTGDSYRTIIDMKPGVPVDLPRPDSSTTL